PGAPQFSPLPVIGFAAGNNSPLPALPTTVPSVTSAPSVTTSALPTLALPTATTVVPTFVPTTVPTVLPTVAPTPTPTLPPTPTLLNTVAPRQTTAVPFSGSGWPPSRDYSLLFDGRPIAGGGVTSTTGAFQGSFVIPANTTAGPHTVTATSAGYSVNVSLTTQ